jgi:hypothetical protein
MRTDRTRLHATKDRCLDVADAARGRRVVLRVRVVNADGSASYARVDELG